MMGMPLAGLLLFSCGLKEKVDNLKEDVQGLVDPMIAQGLVLGIEAPEDAQITAFLEAAAIDSGTAITVYLADAKTASSANDAPVSGADVTLRGATVVPLQEQGLGSYGLHPPATPEYVEGQLWTVEVLYGGDRSTIAVALPQKAVVDVPAQHEARTDMVIDMEGQGFDAALVLVIDGTGHVTWTNEPTTVQDAINLSAGADDMTQFTIPGAEAFPTEGAYAVGVAGVEGSVNDDVDNLNTLLSKLRAGKMTFYPVSTVPLTAP